ncbi:DUF6932 family protein [Peribacillus deserti]|nr:hypothetical protein [Peribacillus deserti]
MNRLTFNEKGNLVPGIHELNWGQFTDYYGYNERRKLLLTGLEKGIKLLKKAGCEKVYVDGSFVSIKEFPNDFEVCWEEKGVHLKQLKQIEPLFFIFKQKRKAQKAKYMGEFFPANRVRPMYHRTIGRVRKMRYLDFFQTDKRTDEPKGIIAIDLRTIKD